MRIAFVTKLFPKLSKTFELNQIKGLIDRGHEVEIFAFNDPEEDKEHQLVEEYNLRQKTTYFDPPLSYTGAAIKTPIDFFKLGIMEEFPEALELFKHGKLAPRKINAAKNFKQLNDFDIVHFHFGTTAINLMHFKDFSDAKIITSFYGSDVSKPPRNLSEPYYNVFKGSDRIISITDTMKDDLIELGGSEGKIEVVSLGIDTSEFRFEERVKKPDEPFKILTVGRFVEKKGIKYGLEAVAELKEEYDIEYNIVGDGELRDEIEEKIEELGLQEEVTLHGYVEYSEMRNAMYKNHILLAPSVTAEDGDKEGAPMVIIEGQATGMPVISTRHSGIPEIVEEGRSAYLAEERSSKELAEKLEKILEESDQWLEKGSVGREFIEKNHSIDRMVEKLENIYRD